MTSTTPAPPVDLRKAVTALTAYVASWVLVAWTVGAVSMVVADAAFPLTLPASAWPIAIASLATAIFALGPILLSGWRKELPFFAALGGWMFIRLLGTFLMALVIVVAADAERTALLSVLFWYVLLTAAEVTGLALRMNSLDSSLFQVTDEPTVQQEMVEA